MDKLINKLKSQQGMYSIVFVSVISFVFLVISLNLSKNVNSYIQFETTGKEEFLRGRVVREVKEHLYDFKICENSFDKLFKETTKVKYDSRNIIFHLDKDEYSQRGFKEKGLPKARKMTLLSCNDVDFKNGVDSDCKGKKPFSIQDENLDYNFSGTLKIDFQEFSNPDELYPYYVPIYLKTQKDPTVSQPSKFETCSTFEPYLSNFYCPPMKFEFSCCRYVYHMDLKPQLVKPKTTSKDGQFPANNNIIYTQERKPVEKDIKRIIPTTKDPKPTKKNNTAIKDCEGRNKIAVLSAVCTFNRGWKVFTECIK